MTTLRLLPSSLQRKSIEELNETPARLQDDIEALRDWIRQQPHLNSRTSDQFLVAFLRTSKFSLERAKEKIDKYYTLRLGLPEIFSNRISDDSKILEILKLGVAIRLPSTDSEDGPRISIIRCGCYDPNKYTFADIIKVGSIIGDIQIIEDDNSVISGYIEILDMKDVTPAHLFHLDMSFLKKLSVMSEQGMPIRHKGIHFINTPPTFETIFNTFRGFMSEKSRNRLIVHGNNLESLYKHIPRRLLPAEYGGENGTIMGILDDWEKKFINYREYFLDEEKYGTNEKLRIGNQINVDQLFGLQGSFRKLNVD